MYVYLNKKYVYALGSDAVRDVLRAWIVYVNINTLMLYDNRHNATQSSTEKMKLKWFAKSLDRSCEGFQIPDANVCMVLNKLYLN